MKDVIRMLIAPLAWLGSFSAVYGLHGLLCGHWIGGAVSDVPLARTLLIGAYGLAMLIQLTLLVALYHPRIGAPPGLVRFVSRATGWVGLVATGWSLFPVVVTTYCS